MYRAVNSKSYKRSVKIKTAMISAMLIISSLVYGYVSINRSSDEKIMKVGLVFSGVFFILGIVNIFVFKYYIYRTLKKTMMKSLKNSRDIFGKTIFLIVKKAFSQWVIILVFRVQFILA